MADVVTIITETGERIERDFTPEEIAQREKDLADAAAWQAEFEAQMAARQAARESAIAKLLDLGLTQEEVEALVGG